MRLQDPAVGPRLLVAQVLELEPTGGAAVTVVTAGAVVTAAVAMVGAVGGVGALRGAGGP